MRNSIYIYTYVTEDDNSRLHQNHWKVQASDWQAAQAKFKARFPTIDTIVQKVERQDS